MRKVERYIDIDPGAEIEGKLLNALADVLNSVQEEEAADALAAFRGIGVRVYTDRLMREVGRLKDLAPSP